MFKKTQLFVYSLLLIFTIGSIQAAGLTNTVDFSRSELEITGVSGYDHIYMRGCDLTDQAGKPQLPVYIHHMSLPAGAVITDVVLVSTRDELLPGQFNPFPVQPPAILGIPGRTMPVPEFVEPDRSVYSSSAPYPGRIVEPASSGRLGDSTIGAVLIHPLTFRPDDGQLVFHSSIEFRVEYELSGYRMLQRSRVLAENQNLMREMQRALTGNESGFQGIDPGSGKLQEMNGDDYPYIVITSNELRSSFRPLVDWKTKKGVRATTVTTEYIYQNFTGVDQADKVRNFIIDAYQNTGAQWILLGGDINVVPRRIAWAMECEAGFSQDEDDLQADLYYSDLDGTWDADDDFIYGEVTDNIEMYPDVIVARASAENTSEVDAFVSKLLAYERTPTPDYQTSMLMAAEILWHDPYTDAGIGADRLDSLYIPPRFDPITKLYQSQGNENKWAVMDALNEGQNIFNHDGHCWYDYMSMGDGGFDNGDMDDLVNGERNGILYSIGCWPGAFDYDCAGEHFITNPDGGGIGFIGNSRYGWGSPGNPGFGYSERLVDRFYHNMFLDGIERPAVALALSKSYYVSRSQDENVYRIHEYEVNILGDPEMILWTDIPRPAIVSHPDSVMGVNQVIPISVRTAGGPVADALVCVMGDNVYQVGRTNLAGMVTLSSVPASEESLMVTVTGRHLIPYEGTIRVLANGPRAAIATVAVADSIGNGDQFLNPGEIVNLTIGVMNTGTDSLTGVTAVLDILDDYCTLIDTTETFGEIAVSDTAYGAAGVRLQIDAGCEGGHFVYIPVVISASGGHVWSGSMSFIVREPGLACQYFVLDDTQVGDADSLLDAGETATLRILVSNSGLGNAFDVTANVTSLSSDIAVTGSPQALGTLAPGSEQIIEFGITADAQVETPSFPSVTLELSDLEEYSMADTIMVTVGTERLDNDFESGEGLWTHGGTNDEWHLSTLNPHSGTYGWYCGDDIEQRYRNRMEANLITPAIFVAPNARFSFWCAYEVTIYGVDGIYVEANDGDGWDKLDFIGSGGALDSLLNISSVWHKESYDLSHYPVGTRLELRLRFSSDNVDIDEGFYIDDVSSNCPVDTSSTGIGEEGSGAIPKAFALSQNYPNPFNPSTTISFGLPVSPVEDRRVSLTVYDMRGRRVRRLIDSTLEPGDYRVVWNGRDDNGRKVPSGIYFYTLKSGESTFTRKMTILK
jgi:hypothetical protein